MADSSGPLVEWSGPMADSSGCQHERRETKHINLSDRKKAERRATLPSAFSISISRVKQRLISLSMRRVLCRDVSQLPHLSKYVLRHNT